MKSASSSNAAFDSLKALLARTASRPAASIWLLSLAPVLFELDLAAMLAAPMPQYREVSKFPPVIRDLAVVVDEAVPARALLEAMQSSRPALVQDLWLFDLYRGKGVDAGKKSLAFRVVMQDTSKTLTDAETEAAMAQLLQLLIAGVGAKLRT